MTKPFFFFLKKKDYLDLVRQLEKIREYIRDYMQAKRDSGQYKYFKRNGKSIFQNLVKLDEKKNNQKDLKA